MSCFKKRVLRLAFLNFSIIAVSIIYFLVFSSHPELFKCKFLETFHFPCPGCGGSRSVSALLSFRFLKSFLLYPPITIASLVILHFDIRELYSLIFKKDIKPFPQWEIIIAPLSIILFFIIRAVLFFLGFDLLSFAAAL